MCSKRAAENEGEHVPRKIRRQRYSNSVRTMSFPDPNYGQRAVFGDLELLTTVPTGDSDLDCEDDTEALTYLRSVRVQASAIPHVMVASKAGPQPPPQAAQHPDDIGDQQPNGDEERVDRSIYQDGRGDFRGYYHDGAYIAYPPGYFDEDEDEGEAEYEYEYEYEDEEQDDGEVHAKEDGNYDNGSEKGEDLDLEDGDESDSESSEGGPRNSNSDEIRDAYFTSLTNKYLALRQVLQTDPPYNLLSSLPKSNPTEVGDFGPKSDTFAKWSGRLRGTDPLPVQIAAMHKDSVLRLLRIILGGKFLRKNQELWERTSRWIWALLARLPERGELDYQEIGWIRELGKRAVLLMVSLAEMEVLKEHYDVGDGSGGSQGEAEVDVDGGVDEEMSLNECCDYDEIDTDVNDADAHYRDPNGPKNVKLTPPKFYEHDDQSETNTQTTSKGKGIAKPETTPPEAGAEEPSDVEMQIDSDDEAEEGEVSEPPQQQEAEPTADIERAKARLLEQLDAARAAEEEEEAEPPATALEEEAFHALAADEEEAKRERHRRAKVNERATLNMILTVAGEFYGQRDLLEFRDPFGGLHFE